MTRELLKEIELATRELEEATEAMRQQPVAPRPE